MVNSRILIKDACVITLDEQLGEFRRASILIEDDKIVAIAPDLIADNARVIDGTDRIVIPGFVDAHRHTHQVIIRNLNSNMTFDEYFQELMSVYAPLHRPEEIYAGTLLGALECLDAGITTLQDWSLNLNTPQHADAAVEALAESGIRALFAYGPPFNPFREWWWKSELPHPEDARRVRQQYFNSEKGLLTFGLALRGPEFTTPQVNRHDFDLARDLNAWICLHVDAPGTIEAMEDYLGPDTMYVHGCRLSDRDFELIKASGGFINVTPECEMGLHNAPITGRALAHGLKPSLGVDGAGTISADMFVQMRMALQQERMRVLQEGWNAGHPPHKFAVMTKDALDWATLQGAKSMGLGDVTGSLTPGKQADLVMLRTDGIHLTPMNDPVSAAVLTAGPRDIDTVMVAGKVVKQNGKLIGYDLERVKKLAIASRDYLFEAGGVPRSAKMMATVA